MAAPGRAPTPTPTGACPVSFSVLGKVWQMSAFPNPPTDPVPSHAATALAASPRASQKPNSQVIDSSGSVSLRRPAPLPSSIPRARGPLYAAVLATPAGTPAYP